DGIRDGHVTGVQTCALPILGLRVLTAGAPPAAATIGRVEGEFGWEIIHVYGLTETAPFITICEARPEHVSLPPEERAVLKARQRSEERRVGKECRATRPRCA